MRSSDPTFNLLVPALLKHWKRLQPGLELSAEAFINFSKHFKEQNKIWLAEDEVAQQKRHNNPGAMDIYDMSKSQGICYVCTPQTVGVSHELGLSCDYDIISSRHFYNLPYDVYVMSILLIPTTETISISGVIASYMTHPSIMTQ
jgi:hypothetical protein